MTEQLDPYEITSEQPEPRVPARVRITRIIGELIVLAEDMTTTLALTDIDTAIMYLRHLDRRLAPTLAVIIPEGETNGPATSG